MKKCCFKGCFCSKKNDGRQHIFLAPGGRGCPVGQVRGYPKGFTLIELLVVVLIIGILAAVAVPQYQITVEKARATEAIMLVKQLNNALNLKCLEEGCDSPGFYYAPLDELDIELPCEVMETGTCETKDFIYGQRGGCMQASAERKGSNPYIIWAGTGCGHPEGQLYCYPGSYNGGDNENAVKICRSLNMLEPTDDYYSPI